MLSVSRSSDDHLRFFCEISAVKLQEDFLPRLTKALSVIPEDRIWVREGTSANSIGTILTHMEGNLRQWTVAALHESPDTRDRDAEFAADPDRSSQELLNALRETVEEASTAIRSASSESLLATRTIQIYEVTGIEAIYHAVEHFSYHLGQIVHEAKRHSGQDLKLYPF